MSLLSAALLAQQPPDAGMKGRLRTLGQAMFMYANEYKGTLPADLRLLKPYVRADWFDATVQDLVYTLPPGTKITKIRSPDRYAAVVSKARDNEPMYVLFVDGHVVAYAPTRDQPPAGDRGAAPATQPAAAPAAIVEEIDDAAPAAPVGVPDDASRALIGAWRVRAGDHIATYNFRNDGAFILIFAPAADARANGAGKASGTWKLDGHKLVMSNMESNTSFTVVGEKEEAEIVGLDASALALKTTDRKGRDEQVVLRRSVPFERGKRDNDKIVGTWNNPTLTLVLADSGMAVLGVWKGEWSQRGNRLMLLLALAPPAERGAARAGQTVGMNVNFTVDLVDDTTLVLTGSINPREPQTFTLLRVK